jgi:mono/diheme cytochrome c family protein
MRKLAVFAALLFTCMAVLYFSACNSEKKEPVAVVNKDSLNNAIARGEYLANHVAICIDCHSQRDVTKFSMPVVPGTEGGGGHAFGKAEGIPGEVTPPNITPATLADWTDDEIARAMTQGVNKKGDTLFPVMPYHHYARLTRDDVYSIIAYIRTLKPLDSTTAPRKLLIPPSMYGPLPANTLATNAMPPTSDRVKYGEYITNAAACSECHTPRGPQGPDFSRMFSGGFVFDLGIFKVAVANITPDSATGIGSLSEDAFVDKFKSNSDPNKVNVNPGRENSIMPWSMYGSMKESDLRAIYAYLRTVPPVKNKVTKYPK